MLKRKHDWKLKEANLCGRWMRCRPKRRWDQPSTPAPRGTRSPQSPLPAHPTWRLAWRIQTNTNAHTYIHTPNSSFRTNPTQDLQELELRAYSGPEKDFSFLFFSFSTLITMIMHNGYLASLKNTPRGEEALCSPDIKLAVALSSEESIDHFRNDCAAAAAAAAP